MYCERIKICAKQKLIAGVVVYLHRRHILTPSRVLPLLLYILRIIMDGWIKLHRKMIDKGWYRKPEHKSVWIHLLLIANHKPKEAWFNGKTITVQPGQLITGRKKLSKELNINEFKISRILLYFEKSAHQIAQQKTGQGSLITILNWDEYQITAQQTAQRVHINCTTTAHKQEGKEGKKVKKEAKCVSVKAEELTELFCSTLKEKITVARKKKWSQEFDRIMNRDRRRYSYEVLVKIINHFRLKDEFWAKNFMAPTKLLTTDSDGTKYIERFIEGMGFEPEDPHEQAYKELEARRRNE